MPRPPRVFDQLPAAVSGAEDQPVGVGPIILNLLARFLWDLAGSVPCRPERSVIPMHASGIRSRGRLLAVAAAESNLTEVTRITKMLMALILVCSTSIVSTRSRSWLKPQPHCCPKAI